MFHRFYTKLRRLIPIAVFALFILTCLIGRLVPAIAPGLVFWLMALLFGGAALDAFYVRRRCTARTVGFIVDIKRRWSGKGSRRWQAIVEYERNGVKYRINGASCHKSDLGELAEVYYDPNDPSFAVSGDSHPAVLLAIASVAAVAGVGVILAL